MKRESGYQPGTSSPPPQRGSGFRLDPAVTIRRWAAGVERDPQSFVVATNRKAALRAARRRQQSRGDTRPLTARRLSTKDVAAIIRSDAGPGQPPRPPLEVRSLGGG